MVYNSCLEVPFKAPDKGKPPERVGRKATGLRPAGAGYGRRAPGRLLCLRVEARRARAHQQEGCAYATRINASHLLPRSSCHGAPGVSPPTRSGVGVIGSCCHRMACVRRQATPPVSTGGVHRHHGRPGPTPRWAVRGLPAAEKSDGGAGAPDGTSAPIPTADRQPTHGWTGHV